MKPSPVSDKSDPDSGVSNGAGDGEKSRVSTLLTRICVACRCRKARDQMVKLTVDHASFELVLNQGNRHCNGRSAYLCKSQSCLTQALKGTRLRAALEGRKGKNLKNHRTIKWPLEPQLIQEISAQCAEA